MFAGKLVTATEMTGDVSKVEEKAINGKSGNFQFY